MKKRLILIFFISVIFFSPKLYSDSIESKWKLINQTVEQKKDYILVLRDYEYEIKNSTSQVLWVYDIDWGNDFQDVQFSLTSSKISRLNIVHYYPHDDWQVTWSYSPHFPQFHELKPNNSFKGKYTARFIVDKNTDLDKLSYEFNYIIADRDVWKNWYDYSPEEINNLYCRNFFVIFSSGEKIKNYIENWN